jgi:RimJ/RimL family protein N-acetyltransferase
MTGSEIAILPYAPEHLDGFRAAVDAVARERRWLAFTEVPPREDSIRFTEQILANRHPFFLAVDGDKVVGWCDIAGSDRPTQAHMGSLGIGLLPAYRSRGIGRRLMQAAIEAARARGFERVTLNVHANNMRARALYEKLGFRLEGVMRKAFKIDGYCDDVVVMGLLFEEISSVA